MNILNLIGRKEELFSADITRHEKELSEIVSASRFLVIGGAGSIGQAVTKSLEGQIVTIAQPRTIADGALTTALSPLAFEVIRRHADGIVTASDLHLVHALRFFAERMKIVVEPTGALAFAGARHGGVDLRGKRVGIIISGGNVDLQRFAALACPAS